MVDNISEKMSLEISRTYVVGNEQYNNLALQSGWTSRSVGRFCTWRGRSLMEKR